MRHLIALLLSVGLLLGIATPVAAGKMQSWDVAILIYRSIDASCNGRQITATLSRVEADPAVIASRFDSTVATWTPMNPNVSVFEMGTLRSLTWTGSYCWPAPHNVSLPAGFDSYIVLYDADAEGAPGANPYGGLAYEGIPYGYTYATAIVPDGDQYWFPNNTHPELAALHEWGHGVGGYYRAKYGSRIPGLHDRDAYGYTDDVLWTRDFLSGKIQNKLGIARNIWDDGPPR